MLVAAAEADEALFEAVVEALVPVTVVESEVSVPDLVPVSVELELELVLVPELELDLLLEQTTSVGRSVTPPRAQIDLATLMVVSWSALEHLSAMQQATSAKKDLDSQMHLKSMPQLWGIEPVAQDFEQSGRSPKP